MFVCERSQTVPEFNTVLYNLCSFTFSGDVPQWQR